MNLGHKIAMLARQTIDFLLFTSIFSALCALALCMATEKLLLHHFPSLISPLHFLILGSTLVIYNVHYLMKKSSTFLSDQYTWVTKNRVWNYIFLSIGLLLCFIFIWQLPLAIWYACIALAVFSFAYSIPFLPFKNKHRLKDIGWLKIIILSSVWTVVTAVLPMIFLKQNPYDFPFEILLRYVFLFILCLAFDIRDMQVDLEAGIYTLPNKIGLRNTYRLINVLSIIFILLGVLQYLKFGIGDRFFLLVFTAVFSLWAIHFVKKHSSDKNYLLLVDGQMLLNGLLILIL